MLSVVAAALAIQVGTSHATITSITDEATWQSMAGFWSTAGFEGFLGPVSTQYAGVSFGDFNGGSPYATAFFPYEGQNSMSTVYPYNGGGGGWAAAFNTPVQAVGFWSGDVQFSGSTISIFDSGNGLLGTYDLMGSGGGHGPYLYGFNGFVSNTLDIARVEVAIDGHSGPILDAVWFDNFQYSPIPAPGAIWLLGFGLTLMMPLRRTTRR
jgi:hypothetical protein